MSWLQALVTYGPLGIFAALIGFVWLWRQIKGDPVLELAKQCSAHIAVGNQALTGINGILKEMQTEHAAQDKQLAVLTEKFEGFSDELKKAA